MCIWNENKNQILEIYSDFMVLFDQSIIYARRNPEKLAMLYLRAVL